MQGDRFVAPQVAGISPIIEERGHLPLGLPARFVLLTFMTLELLIHSIVRQTTILIAQLATFAGARAPLAQIADRVFLDLVRELERQGVSRRVSADMFGLGLRTYQRKIQRLSESETDRGRSLWEAVLEYIREQGMVTRAKLSLRFSHDDESQVRSVLHDLCESRLVFSSGTGNGTVYRAASEDDLRTIQQLRPQEGLDELLWAMIYRLGPITRNEIRGDLGFDIEELDAAIARLVESGRAAVTEEGERCVYRSVSLYIPLGSPVGWEAAVFDHYKAVVNTIAARLSGESAEAASQGQVGGSTFTLDVWEGHPMTEEVLGTLSRFRDVLAEQRQRIEQYNAEHGVPDDYTRVLLYVGQCLIDEGKVGDGPSSET